MVDFKKPNAQAVPSLQNASCPNLPAMSARRSAPPAATKLLSASLPGLRGQDRADDCQPQNMQEIEVPERAGRRRRIRPIPCGFGQNVPIPPKIPS